MRTAKLPSFFWIHVQLELGALERIHPMASHKLPNYLRLHRKRLGLSQKEVAFLLGGYDVSKPCRYEHFSRIPSLRTALALAAIFRVSVHELFPGVYEKVEKVVFRQAQRLEARLLTESQDRGSARKLAVLKMILAVDANHP